MAFSLSDRFPLLNLEENDEISTGYDSPVFISDSETESSPSSSDSNYISSSASEPETSSDEDDGDDLDDLEDPVSVQISYPTAMVDNIKYILEMPDLCDVTFLVGPELVPVHGLKAIIGSRSQILKDRILQQCVLQRLRKPKKQDIGNPNNVNIFMNYYDVEVFKQFIYFLHTGNVVMNVTTVVGLACAAEEFGVPDLSSACSGFLKHCAATEANATTLNSELDRCDSHRSVQKVRDILTEIVQGRNRSPTKKETTV